MLGVWPPMAASGLQELLELIYVPNAVVYLLNGKVITWAVRNFIIDSALNALIVASIFNVPVPGGSEMGNNEIVEVTETIQTYGGSTGKSNLLKERSNNKVTNWWKFLHFPQGSP